MTVPKSTIPLKMPFQWNVNLQRTEGTTKFLHHKLWIANFVWINCAWFCFGGKCQPNHRKKPSQPDIIFWKVHGFLRVSLNCWLKIVVHPPERKSWNHGAKTFFVNKINGWKRLKSCSFYFQNIEISSTSTYSSSVSSVTKHVTWTDIPVPQIKVGLTLFSTYFFD